MTIVDESLQASSMDEANSVYTFLLILNGIVYYKIVATEVVRLGVSVVWDYLINERRKIINRKVFVDSEIRGIQKPCKNKCACLNQKYFGM